MLCEELVDMNLSSVSFFCSWSGGKDSCLSLYRAIQAGGKPEYLLTMFTESGDRSRSHGQRLHVIQQQAEALGIPLKVAAASWSTYEAKFIEAIAEFKNNRIDVGIFGDIDLEDHRIWIEKVCSSIGIRPYLPLWQEDRRKIVREFIDAGFKAMVVAIKDGVLDHKFLGQTLTIELMEEIAALGIDPCGEQGEFHTLVYDGPIFSKPMDYRIIGPVYHDGYWFLDLE